MELNGKALADLKDDKTGQVVLKAGQQLPGFAWLKDDGTTMCGNWIYSGCWTEAGSQMQRARHRRSLGHGDLSELGLVVAGESARALQPRLLQSSRASRGIPSASRSGGTKPPENGWAMMCRTSNPTRIRKITWGHSS